jgi:hypothetical protein
MATIADPDGNTFGLYQYGKRANNKSTTSNKMAEMPV